MSHGTKGNTTSQKKLFMVGPKPEFYGTEWQDQFYLAARMIISMRPHIDCIVLPDDCEPLYEYVRFCIRERSYNTAQFIWVSKEYYLLEDAILANWEAVKYQIEPCRGGILIPYAANEKHWDIAHRLGMVVMGEMENFAERWGIKTILHPDVFLSTTPKVGCLANVGLSIPSGYTVNCGEEVLRAMAILREDGIDRFVLKQADGAGGDGIFPNLRINCRIPEKAQFPSVVEEMLDLYADRYGILAPSIQYEDGKWNGTILRQVMAGNSFAGNRTYIPTPQITEKIGKMVEILLRKIKPQGCGGFDFLVDKKGGVYFVDPNPRMTGAHPALWARKQLVPHAPNTPFLAWKADPRVDVVEFWERLKREGIALVNGASKGVFPLCYMPEVWSMLIAVGVCDETLDEFQSRANALLE